MDLASGRFASDGWVAASLHNESTWLSMLIIALLHFLLKVLSRLHMFDSEYQWRRATMHIEGPQNSDAMPAMTALR